MSHFLEERKRLGFGQEFLAEKLDVNRRTIGRWEKESPIPSDKLALLLELGFDINFLLTGKRPALELIDKTAIDLGQAVEAAIYAAEESILSVYQVKRLRKELGVNGEFDAVKNLTLIKRAVGILARAELTGELNQATIRQVLDMADEA
ncbi:helix-turn-helix transcriptional regulator [Pseudoalteromonas obscura]|uniref:Helix-turn-helix domain-containing protein n=1 Tax=Pseudoalteromonas obscura TaxID=3048491 RepID=A0ABT7EUB6_9GAMM|nr:helix-turn-helix domain-containing protein [Pseudoalteromonas sp. P94(2023)]MDK2598641.1 helix-turn-helix domain-containing protein [Pseudoalteromonas sp. P94(2023)]